MAVIIEYNTVVVLNATIEVRFPGGLEEYERQCPNATFSSDRSISRVGFMEFEDAEAYVLDLTKFGFEEHSTSLDSHGASRS